MGLGPSNTDRIVLPDLPRVRIVLNESPEGVGTVVVAPLCRIAGRSARAFDVLDVQQPGRAAQLANDRMDSNDYRTALPCGGSRPARDAQRPPRRCRA